MPRLDNGNKYNLEMMREWGETERWREDFDPADPGKMPPMDVCRPCSEEFDLIGDIEHSSYDDDQYTCLICMHPLDGTYD